MGKQGESGREALVAAEHTENTSEHANYPTYESIQGLIADMGAHFEANVSHENMLATERNLDDAVRNVFLEIEKSKK